MAPKRAQWWLPIALFFTLAAAAGGILLIPNLLERQPVKIVLPTPTPAVVKDIYIGGAVASPGVYTLRDGERLEDLLRAAGGTTDDASPNHLRLTVPRADETSASQRVNINTAEVWLLEALPGIGEKLAGAIVAYRNQNGPFHFAKDITQVPGITPRIYERIEKLITVAE